MQFVGYGATDVDGTVYPTNGALFGAVNYDVAILKIPDVAAKYSLEVMDDPLNNAKVGAPVTVPGNSLGAGVTLQINGKLLGIGPALVEVDAKFVPGNSGSPIIDRRSGQVIGMGSLKLSVSTTFATNCDFVIALLLPSNRLFQCFNRARRGTNNGV